MSGEEGIEPGGEDEYDDPEHSPVGKPGLKSVVVRRLGAVDVLGLAAVILNVDQRR